MLILVNLSFLNYRYPLLPYLLTPLRNPITRGDHRYNSRHKRARSVVEQAFGVLKMRFLCLHKYGGCLVYSPERCIQIIVACFILHNICIDHNIPLEQQEDEQVEEQDEEIYDGEAEQAGVEVRNALIRDRFS